ncbi:MAG: glutathione S-transferase family protein [Terricaulis sp.]
MNPPFRLYGAELSPYSVKVRSYLRFKNIPFEWLQRNQARQEEFARFAKLPLIPVIVDADDVAMQDSTPIIEALEAQFPEPSIIPDDPALAFLSALIEDYADEWLNKAMFHYRWTYPADQESAARRILGMMFEGAESPEGLEESIRVRMVGRLHHVGSTRETAPAIEGSFSRVLGCIEQILAGRSYLFGGRPSLADFGLAGQFEQLLSDPTPGALIRAQAPNLVGWVERMQNPSVEGAFVSFAAGGGALAEFLRTEVAVAYLTWMAANADAIASDAPSVTVDITGAPFSQKPQRYAAKALAELRSKRALVTNEALAALLGETGCDAVLLGAVSETEPDADDDQDADGDEAGEASDA